MLFNSTKELLNAYLDLMPTNISNKIKGTIDRPELYEYERKIGKQMVEMNTEELYQMIKSFYEKRNDITFKYSTLSLITTRYREIFNFYIENLYNETGNAIPNPWNSKALKTKTIIERLVADNEEPLNWQMVEDAICEYRNDNNKYEADYAEFLVRIYHDGIKSASELISITEDMINFKTNEILINNRIVKISDRTMELLIKIHNTTEIYSDCNIRLEYVSWNNSYLKLSAKPSNVVQIQLSDLPTITRKLNNRLGAIKRASGLELTSKVLYLLGFFDFLVSCFGLEKTKEMLMSERNWDYNQAILSAAKEYRIDNNDNISYIKRRLYLFI